MAAPQALRTSTSMATLSSAAARTLTTAPTIGPSLPCSTPNTDRRYADGGCAMTFRMCGVRTSSAASPGLAGPPDWMPGAPRGVRPQQHQHDKQPTRRELLTASTHHPGGQPSGKSAEPSRDE